MEEVTKINLIRSSFVKTVGVCALAVFLCLDGAEAARSSKVRSLVKKARNLSLQRDRVQASKILRDHLRKEGLNREDRKLLLKTLDKVSRMFYTAKALQEYEMAKSKISTEREQALDHFEQSHKLEKLNVLPMQALASEYLTLGSCDKALQWSDKASEVNPYTKKSVYLRLFSLSCLGDYEKIEAFSKEMSWLKKDDYYFLALGQSMFQEGLVGEAVVWLKRVKDKEIPETHYFLGVISKKLSKKDYQKSFTKYVQLCRNIVKVKEKYPNDPRICGESENIKQKYQLPARETVRKVVK